MKNIKIIANYDERVFKARYVIELNLADGLINYIVGSNGSGKSTILHAIRAHKDTLWENMSRGLQMDIVRNHDLDLYKAIFSIEGLDQFENVFCLDAVIDNPNHFANCTTATGLINGGGLYYGQKSRGEGNSFMLSKFVSEIAKITGAKINPETKKVENRPEKRQLIIIDEVDEGFDLHTQSKWGRMLRNISYIFNATIICVCHNPLCILMDNMNDINLGQLYSIYNMDTRMYSTIDKYIDDQCGLKITVTPLNKSKHDE